MTNKRRPFPSFLSIFILASTAGLFAQDMLRQLAEPQDYVSRRASSYDRSGGNKDSLTIEHGHADQDKVKAALHKGWNKLLIKVLTGAGGWGPSLRFADPDGVLRTADDPGK